MAAVPVTIQCIIYPKNKTVEPYPATIVGMASITGLEVGGGPVLPPDTELPPVEPPLVIWGPGDPRPTNPIVIPPPIDTLPPVTPPTTPEKPHPGWNFSQAKDGWYFLYVPGEGEASPKSKR